MINTVGIIGAGTMGNGIAQICAAAGLGGRDGRHFRCGGEPRIVDRGRQPRAPGQEGEDVGGGSRGGAEAHHRHRPTAPSSPIATW